MRSEGELFDDRRALPLGPGAVLLGGFAAESVEGLLSGVSAIESTSPFRHLATPGGRRMSVAMTNAGPLGWISDRRGYRYDAEDPETGAAWPAMPATFLDLAVAAAAAAGFDGFEPDACLVNRYTPGSRLTLHQDRDEASMEAPIVSVSLGLSATFLWGGLTRSGRVRRTPLHHGDVVVWGGASRLTFHGVDTLAGGVHPLTGPWRYNLTFRRAR